MAEESLELLTSAPLAVKYRPEQESAFYNKSNSPHTRRAYLRVLREFFQLTKWLSPTEIKPIHVIAWRDYLLKKRRQKPNTVAFKLSVLRSFFDYLVVGGVIRLNPAATKLVPPPALPEDLAGRALTVKEARLLLGGPDQRTVLGARDHALMLTMLRLSIRVSEVCSLKASSIKWSHGRWILKFKVKGGRERTLPLPDEVRAAIKAYLSLDQKRRRTQHCDGDDAFIFQPQVNFKTLEFDKPLTERMVHLIVKRWAEFVGVGKVSPHDLRRTAITKALEQGLSYRQVQMMSGHRDPKTVMKYDHARDNLDQNAVNFLDYGEII